MTESYQEIPMLGDELTNLRAKNERLTRELAEVRTERNELKAQLLQLGLAEVRSPFRDRHNVGVEIDKSSVHAEACCDMHNQHCEPPGDLCCWKCTEVRHPQHPVGVRCVLATSNVDGEVAS